MDMDDEDSLALPTRLREYTVVQEESKPSLLSRAPLRCWDSTRNPSRRRWRASVKSARIEHPHRGRAREESSADRRFDGDGAAARLGLVVRDRQSNGGARDRARALDALSAGRQQHARDVRNPLEKGVEALLDRVKKLGATDSALASFALGVAWLIATGRRTRGDVETVAKTVPACAGHLTGDERATRTWVEGLAASV